MFVTEGLFHVVQHQVHQLVKPFKGPGDLPAANELDDDPRVFVLVQVQDCLPLRAVLLVLRASSSLIVSTCTLISLVNSRPIMEEKSSWKGHLPRPVSLPGHLRLGDRGGGYSVVPEAKRLCRRTWMVDDFFVRAGGRTGEVMDSERKM